MSRRRGVSLVITKRTLILFLTGLIMVVAAFTLPAVINRVNRSLNGVPQGVTLAGYSMEGMLEAELYDAVASLAEQHYVEAQNASFDWQTNEVLPEKEGVVVDINQTVELLLNAEANTNVEFAQVQVLPSITQAHFKPYYRGPAVDPKMTLMVNVDWGDEFIPSMLETFERFNVVTTWFPTGRWVKNSPELAKEIADAGHEIGNHGGWHGMPSQMSREEVAELITEGEEIIVEATGQKPVVFAPPAGDMNDQTVAVAAELGYKTVLWTIDTIDWQKPAPTVIIDRVVGKAQNGALVLMHPTKSTAEALPVIIQRLKDEGYALVTVSELLSE